MSTHDLELALQISDKIWLMDKANGILPVPRGFGIEWSFKQFLRPERIVFDKDTGLFRIDNQFSRQIRLVDMAARNTLWCVKRSSETEFWRIGKWNRISD